MVKPKETRREKEAPKLDIDRRKVESRRDESRRQFIDEAYATIYIPSYVNSVYPKFPVNVHAFSNFEKQIDPAMWAVNDMGIEHANAQKPLKNLKDFALLLIEKGLVTNGKGEDVSAKSVDFNLMEKYFLKTGT